MVGVDASIALALWFPDVPSSVPKAKERVEYLVQNFASTNERILIPTPALSEVLVRAGSAGLEFVNQMARSSRFEIAPFDTLAAIEVSIAIASAIRSGNKRGKNMKDTWAKIKFDHQIVAICKVREVKTLYSDDPGLCSFAERMGIHTYALADLPLPTEEPNLFSQLEEQMEQPALPAPTNAAPTE